MLIYLIISSTPALIGAQEGQEGGPAFKKKQKDSV